MRGMRSTEDVLSRILHDGSLDPTQFNVGFLGLDPVTKERKVTERRVDKFAAANDKARGRGHSAVPLTAIKYFKYVPSGEIVYDRENKIDEFFGSQTKQQQRTQNKTMRTIQEVIADFEASQQAETAATATEEKEQSEETHDNAFTGVFSRDTVSQEPAAALLERILRAHAVLDYLASSPSGNGQSGKTHSAANNTTLVSADKPGAQQEYDFDPSKVAPLPDDLSTVPMPVWTALEGTSDEEVAKTLETALRQHSSPHLGDTFWRCVDLRRRQ
ncbi:MAG: hypothetical protein MHM6MM_001552 [Cercozoa sp. M6MM]